MKRFISTGTQQGIKRFWRKVSIQQNNNEFLIHLGLIIFEIIDGKTLKTPDSNILICPNFPMALMIASEWEAPNIRANSLPLVNINGL